MYKRATLMQCIKTENKTKTTGPQRTLIRMLNFFLMGGGMTKYIISLHSLLMKLLTEISLMKIQGGRIEKNKGL